MLAAQDTGQFNLFKVGPEPEPVSDAIFNYLSMIYKVEMLPNVVDDPDWEFVLGTNNGIAFMKVNKENLRMTITREGYLGNKIVNNLLTRGNRIIAFEHNATKFRVIDRTTQTTIDIPWL